jgi:hypothetical protein
MLFDTIEIGYNIDNLMFIRGGNGLLIVVFLSLLPVLIYLTVTAVWIAYLIARKASPDPRAGIQAHTAKRYLYRS